jgi:hypothetical protein
MTTNTQPSNIDEYIDLYNRIFLLDKPAKIIQTKPAENKDNKKDLVAIDLSKLKVPSIYANFSGQGVIQRNGLNIGDGYSYLDFKKHTHTGTISFYRRNPDKTMVSMEYIPSEKRLYSIVNGQRNQIRVIKELQQVLDQISTM